LTNIKVPPESLATVRRKATARMPSTSINIE
jgi:hypothetical protein